MIKFLVPLLLLVVFTNAAADFMLNAMTSGASTKPFVSLDTFNFGQEDYCVMFHAEFDSISGSSSKQTIVHLFSATGNVESTQDDHQVIIDLVSSTQIGVAFGSRGYYKIFSLGNYVLSPNQLHSFVICAEQIGEANQKKVHVSIYVNDALRSEGETSGKITAGDRVGTLCAFTNDDGVQTQHMNGLFDNFVIVSQMVGADERKTFHTMHKDWGLSNELLADLGLWLHFNDAMLAVNKKAVALTTSTTGNSEWITATIVGDGFLTGHSSGGNNWQKCRSTGDPHYYRFPKYGGNHHHGGEKLLGEYVFHSCGNDVADPFEIRTHTRMVQWWGNTVFRIAVVRYKDYLWRVNLYEKGNGYTRHNYDQVQKHCEGPGRYHKHVTAKEWMAIGDGSSVHQATGARYYGWSGKNLRITVPNVAMFEVHPHNPYYMNLYLEMNLDYCANNFGSCRSNLYVQGQVFFDELIGPTPLPEGQPPIPDSPCDGVTTEVKNNFEKLCGRRYKTEPFYSDCVFDACASGDPSIIPDVELTDECQLERLTGVSTGACDNEIVRCVNGDVSGSECVCDPGYGGYDCGQETSFTCHEVKYSDVAVNLQPKKLFKIPSIGDNLQDKFTEYSVIRSILIYPTEYDGKNYLQVVASSPLSHYAGKARVCLDTTGSVDAVSSTVYKIRTPADQGLVTGEVDSDTVTAWPQLCVDMSWPKFSVGGFYFEITGQHKFNVYLESSNDVDQVLVGAGNGRGGLDVVKIPSRYHATGFEYSTDDCDNSLCYVHDEDCRNCHSVTGCGFCLETQRCMSGNQAGPSRGVCENWRVDLEQDISRVVTVKYNAKTLVDPSYEVFLASLSAGSTVPVDVFVPTGRTNDNIDIQFKFGVGGDYAANAAILKTNLLSAMYTLPSAVNLGVGFYGDLGADITLGLTLAAEENEYWFARALEAPSNLHTTNGKGGVFKAVQKAAQVSWRQFSRRLAVFTVYDTDSASEGTELAKARSAVLKKGILPIFLVPTTVSDTVASYWRGINDNLNGFPCVVIRVNNKGSDFKRAFRTVLQLSGSYPHVIIEDTEADSMTHVDLDTLEFEADALSISGLIDTRFRARFVIPMLKGDNSGPKEAVINVPGFGSSHIHDVPSTGPVNFADQVIVAKEGTRCVKVTLKGSAFQSKFSEPNGDEEAYVVAPVFELTALPDPAQGALHEYDQNNQYGIGAAASLGYTIQKTFCYVPASEYSHSSYNVDEDLEQFDKFTYLVTDGCTDSATADIIIYIEPDYRSAISQNVIDTILETDQEAVSFTHPITVDAWEYDYTDTSNTALEQVTFTYSNPRSVNHRTDLLGEDPSFQVWSKGGSALEFGTGSDETPITTLGADFGKVSQTINYTPIEENWFGTLRMRLSLSGGNTSPNLYKLGVNVVPENDLPTVLSEQVGFTDVGKMEHQFTKEDTPYTITITGDDIDNYGIAVEVKVNFVDSGFGTVTARATGQILEAGNTYTDICVSSANSGHIVCNLDVKTDTDYYSCDPLGNNAVIDPVVYDSIVTDCPNPFLTIEYRTNDRNTVYQKEGDSATVEAGTTAWQTLNLHVLSVNDRPDVPPTQNIYLVEDAGENNINADPTTVTPQNVDVLVTDVDDAQDNLLELSLQALCKNGEVTLAELSQSGTVITTSPHQLTPVAKRASQRSFSLDVATLKNIHGVDKDNDFLLCQVPLVASDSFMSSDEGFLNVHVRPFNDAPYDLRTSFTKKEDVTGSLENILDLTASDLDSDAATLVYQITQLPYHDEDKGEGILIYPMNPTTEERESVALTADDLPYTVLLDDENRARIIVDNVQDWYGLCDGGACDALVYTVTDTDKYLNEGETGYTVHTVESTVTIEILPVNDRPVVSLQAPAGPEDTVQVIFLEGKDLKFEEGDPLNVIIEAVNADYSSDYSPASYPTLFYVYDDVWYNQYLLDGEVDTTTLTSVEVDTVITDEEHRILFVPPQHMNKQASQSQTPLYVLPSLKYRMVETSSHAEPQRLRSSVSFWVEIVVSKVNDVPVAAGQTWEVDSAYEWFYGESSGWTYPEDYGRGEFLGSAPWFDSLCVDNCFFTEDYGRQGEIFELSPRLITFGGRDVEGDELQIKIDSADCGGRNVVFNVVNGGGEGTPSNDMTASDLVDLVLTKTIARDTDGYDFVEALYYTPVIDDWNVVGFEHPNFDVDEHTGYESDYYCQIGYVVIDEEGAESPVKTITINVRESNDQPQDTVSQSQDPTAKNVIGYEDSMLLLPFHAKDKEGDDFYLNVVSCTSRGTFYGPKPSQKVNDDGSLDWDRENPNAVFDMNKPLDCFDLSTFTPLFSKNHENGWYFLHEPAADDFGPEYDEITVEYYDGVDSTQAPQNSTRTITVRAVNDAPEINVNIAVDGVTAFGVKSKVETSFGVSFSDKDAGDFPYAGFRIAVVDYVLDDENFEESPYSYKFSAPFGFNAADAITDIVQWDANQNGHVQWESSFSQATGKVKYVTMTFVANGEFNVEIVAVDGGFTGYCAKDENGVVLGLDTNTYASDDIRTTIGRNGEAPLDEALCNRVSVTTVSLIVTDDSLLVGSIATGAGAGLLALVAIGAILFAKFKEPEELGAWSALETAQMTNVQTNADYQAATNVQTSAIHE